LIESFRPATLLSPIQLLLKFQHKKMTVSIRVIPKDKLYVSEPNPISFGNVDNPPISLPHWTNDNWLQSRFHFAFAEYDNVLNERFGVLRVINDDLVQPERGFATHGHRDMEIVTYIVHGELTHEDSIGNKETLRRGSIQYMTAGTGVEHSEHNHNEDTPMRCIQTWILPAEYGLQPRYGSYSPADPNTKVKVGDLSWQNKLRHLVTNINGKSEDWAKVPVKVHQDVDCYTAELEAGAQIIFELPKGRMAYIVCIEGGVSVASETPTKHTTTTTPIQCSSHHYQMLKYDGCEITGSGGALSITCTDTEETENGDLAHILMFTMASVPGAGRTDF
jgi:redox-sensitive bicupin YhaK (pirin superfamily)